MPRLGTGVEMMPLSLSRMPLLSSSKKVTATEFVPRSSTSATTGAATLSMARSDTSSHEVARSVASVIIAIPNADFIVDSFLLISKSLALLGSFAGLLHPPQFDLHVVGTSVEGFGFRDLIRIQ